MYHIVRTKSFERSYRKIKASGKFKSAAQQDLINIIDTLAAGEPLAKEYRDHSLTGELSRFRECHIKGDLLLVYQKIEDDLVLVLVDMGSHSEIFG